jgi:hypothetical protein
MNVIIKTSIILFLINFTIQISAQEIKVTEFRSDPMDISARENALYDANGDACAIIKLRSGLQNLKFASDLGISKVENHGGEYWLWVSPNTKKINIEAEGIGKLEYELPALTQEYLVYVIFLAAILPDKIQYKNINSVRIETRPSKAEVYIDKAFIGYSPVNFNISEDTFQYEIRKKKSITVTGDFVNSVTKNELFVPLKRNPKVNRMFLSLFCGGNKPGTPFFGLQTGMIGKTGWYISYVPPIRSRKYIAKADEFYQYYGIDNLNFSWNENMFLKLTGESPEGYYVRLKDKNNTFLNHTRIKLGITQRVSNNIFLKAGVGTASSTRYFRLKVIPYSNNPSLEVPLNKAYYGIGRVEIEGPLIETGLVYRMFNRYLVELNLASLIDAHIKYRILWEGTFGIGYNF